MSRPGEMERQRAAERREVWRTGRHNRPHIYRQVGDDPHDDDPWIGHMDTPELAALVVAAVNAYTAEGET